MGKSDVNCDLSAVDLQLHSAQVANLSFDLQSVGKAKQSMLSRNTTKTREWNFTLPSLIQVVVTEIPLDLMWPAACATAAVPHPSKWLITTLEHLYLRFRRFTTDDVINGARCKTATARSRWRADLST